MKHASSLAKGTAVALAMVLASIAGVATSGTALAAFDTYMNVTPHGPSAPSPMLPGAPGTVSQIGVVKTPPCTAGKVTNKPLCAGFDISWVDPSTQMLYVADHGLAGVDEVNAQTGAFVTTLGLGTFSGAGSGPASCGAHGTGGPDGVLSLTVGGVNQVWAGNGVSPTNVSGYTSTTSSLNVFALSSSGMATSETNIQTGGLCRADELAYDPVDHVVAIANDVDTPPYLSFISVHAHPANDTVVGAVYFPNASDGIEQTIWNPVNNMFYVNLPQVTPPSTSSSWVGNIDEINPTTEAVVKTFPVTACSPGGLALDVQRQTLLLGCSSDAPASGLAKDVTMLMDARNGRILSTVTQVGGSDEVWYDSGNHTYYTASSNDYSNGDPATGYSTPVLGIIGQNGRWLGNFPTLAGSHSVAADASNNHVFVPMTGYGIAIFQGSGPVAPFPGPGRGDHGHGPGH